jgi:CheY-like chemotaxis protein
VVEDEVLVRLAVADYLRRCGYRVLEAGSGDEALVILGTGEAVELVFSDVQMPGATDGFGLARWVREHRPGVDVILTSGMARKAEKAGDLCGHGPLLAKPYNHDRLLRRIRELLARAERAAPP